MLLIRLTPQEEYGYRLAGDCPEGEEQNTIALMLAEANMSDPSIETLAAVLGPAAQRARAIITEARRFQILLCDESQTTPRYELELDQNPE